MNPAMSWTIFCASLVLSGILIFCRSDRRNTVLAVASALLATWLVGKYTLIMLLCLEGLFRLLKWKPPQSRSTRFGGWTAIGIIIGLLPFIALLAGEAASLSLGSAAIFAFFSLQLVGGFLHLWFSDKPSDMTRGEWYTFGLFFPTLITGPIIRWPALHEQMRTRKPFHINDGIESLRLLARGLFKRLVFAAPFYMIANEAVSLNALTNLPLLLVFAAGLRFAIWADISGHTDWARGIALLFGFKLPENFNLPFQTFSVLEFWRRWHVTLTSWIQDYVYYPLVSTAPLRRIPRSTAIALAVVISFSFLGLWHGFRTDFLVMGLLKGFGVLLSLYLLTKWPRLYLVLSPLLLTGFVILPTALLKIDWTLFSNSLFTATEPWSATLIQLGNITAFLTRYGVDKNPLGWIAALAVAWQCYERLERHSRRLPALIEILLLLIGILALATPGNDTRFLYAPIGQ
ncbi:MAG: hypothetical protein JNJ49_06670 [Bdellovibrionaceae bacterium]|nr:hypothetical protein [Pseudobdellovibrionaceae bacterium]